MTDRITITDARKMFERWVEAVGGITTSAARAKGWPVTNTFHLEEWRIGDGKTTVRIAQITSESGAERGAIGDGRRSPREFVDMIRAAIETLEVKRRLPRHDPGQDRVVLPEFLVLTKADPDPNRLTYTDQFGRVWSSIMSKAGKNCAEVTCGRHFQAGYVLNGDSAPTAHDPDWMKRPTICVSHILEGGYHRESFFRSSEYQV